jgi:N-acetylglucosaminyldiphosphoundecaprenol N-acetyl-beta-D-mannosaminyltransferase
VTGDRCDRHERGSCAIEETPLPVDRRDPHRSRAGLATVRLFGFDFIDDVDLDATVAALLAPQPDDGLAPLVSTPNVDHLVQMQRPEQADLAELVASGRYVLPDGQPIVWTSRLAGRPLGARLPGSTLLAQLWPRLVQERRRVFVLAASEQVAAELRAADPGLALVVPPMFDVDDVAALGRIVADCVAGIVEHRPEFVVIGLGAPKAQRIIQGCLRSLDGEDVPLPVFLALGDSFAMMLGIVPRAPEWMQRSGLEWFHRFVREPRRLFRRYFVDDVRFLPMLVREVRRSRSRASR